MGLFEMTLENNHAATCQEEAREFYTIKILDVSLEWLEHDEHWLTSRKSANCTQCIPQTPGQLNQTFTCVPNAVRTTATKRKEQVEDLIDLNETFEVKPLNHTINNSETSNDMPHKKAPAKLNVTVNGPSRLKPVTMIPKYRFGAHLKNPS